MRVTVREAVPAVVHTGARTVVPAAVLTCRAVLDAGDAEAPEAFSAFGRGGDRGHRAAGQGGQLRGHQSDATAGAPDQDPFALLDVRPLQAQARDQGVHAECDGVRRAD